MLIKKFSELPSLDKLHNEEQDVSVLEARFHFNQIWVRIRFHDFAFKLDHFDDIVIDEHPFFDSFNCIKLIILTFFS